MSDKYVICTALPMKVLQMEAGIKELVAVACVGNSALKEGVDEMYALIYESLDLMPMLPGFAQQVRKRSFAQQEKQFGFTHCRKADMDIPVGEMISALNNSKCGQCEACVSGYNEQCSEPMESIKSAHRTFWASSISPEHRHFDCPVCLSEQKTIKPPKGEWWDIEQRCSECLQVNLIRVRRKQDIRTIAGNVAAQRRQALCEVYVYINDNHAGLSHIHVDVVGVTFFAGDEILPRPRFPNGSIGNVLDQLVKKHTGNTEKFIFNREAYHGNPRRNKQ